MAGHAHLEFAVHEVVFQFVDEAKLRAGSGGVGEEDGCGWIGRRNVVVDDVALVVEVNGTQRLAGRILKDVQQVAVVAVEVGRSLQSPVLAL